MARQWKALTASLRHNGFILPIWQVTEMIFSWGIFVRFGFFLQCYETFVQIISTHNLFGAQKNEVSAIEFFVQVEWSNIEIDLSHCYFQDPHEPSSEWVKTWQKHLTQHLIWKYLSLKGNCPDAIAFGVHSG